MAKTTAEIIEIITRKLIKERELKRSAHTNLEFAKDNNDEKGEKLWESLFLEHANTEYELNKLLEEIYAK